MHPEYSRIRVSAVMIAIGVVICFVALYCSQAPPSQRTKIVFAVSCDPSSAPIFVAQDKGFFNKEGLDVELLMHTTGRAAFASMREGKARLATVADTVLMFAGMDNAPISAIATISDSNAHHKIIALRTRGITQAADLEGKRIGVSTKTSGEFFLYSFLLLRDIPVHSVRFVNLAPEDMFDALVSGKVDAVATWYPTARSLANRIGDRAVTFASKEYSMTWNIVGMRQFIEENPQTIEKILRGLLRARTSMTNHPDESIAITAKYSQDEQGRLRDQWENYDFDISLGEGLLVSLEDQARWASKTYYHGARPPDFKAFVYTTGLRNIKPSAVSIRATGL
jgi:NitT/TauT family transport system substrate-binding protein